MARLLVIEDNPDNLELMTYLLRAFGHDVATAGNGEDGLQAVEHEAFDLIVCDVHLPRMDGYEIARRLKGNPARAAIPLVAVTALAMVGDRDKVLAAGFDGYIAKPITPQEFVGQVEAFLPGRQTVAEPVPAPPPASAVSPPAPASGPRVLVVDDSAINRELARSTLVPFGYRLTLVTNIQQALDAMVDGRFDLVVSDLHMPEGDGFALIRAVKANPAWAAIPFMFISSSVLGGRDRDKALALGACRFVMRPIEPQALLAEVAACLGSASGEDYGDRAGR